jgi:thiopeptide-type bacteriocin biosynthesis protein
MPSTSDKEALGTIAHSGFWVLRTPLLPLDEFLSWGDGLETRGHWEAGAPAETLERSWASDVRLLRDRLKTIVERPEILQALYVASPSLRLGIEHWQRDPDSKKGLQAERSIVRYFARMSARSTPFGLFSGLSVGSVGEEDEPTALVLAPRSQYRSSSRLDFDYLFALTTALRSDPALTLEMRYWTNSSLRRIAGAWHYTEARLAGANRSHHLVKLEDDVHLSAAIARAESGATVSDLVQAVMAQDLEDPLPEDEVREYVLDLIRSDVLVPALAPLVTGEPALADLIRQLEALPSGASPARTLRAANAALADLDARGLGSSPAAYEAIAADLGTLPAAIDVAKLYQVDMVKPAAAAKLGTVVTEELVRGIEVLLRIGGTGEPEGLKSFREAFARRYEQAVVPFLEALDEETGIPLGSPPTVVTPLLKGLQFVEAGRGHAGAHDDRLRLLLRRAVQGSGDPNRELELDPAELPPAPPVTELPDAFCVMATIVARSTDAISEGEFQVIFSGGYGPSGARTLGRFCHADPDLERHVREHLRQEEALDPQAVYAEVVYMPEGRLGNVICRPLLREYEIPYLGRSSAPPDRQLPLSDLLIGIEGERIVLRSRRLGRRVVPRMANAHNFRWPTLPAVYRLLCLLQNQGGRTFPGFTWGTLDALDFLPRLRVGRAVLSVARWKLSAAELKELTQPGRKDVFLAAQELRRRRGLPRWVLYPEQGSDNALPTDLDNPLSVDALSHVLKRAASAILLEMYPTPDELCVTSEEGRFCHELHVPMELRRRLPAPDTNSPRPVDRRTAAAVNPEVRTRPPGSDWLYVKVYGGTVVLDEVLTATLPPLLEAAEASGALARWFFVRYQDPHDHLRMRFNAEPERLQKDVLPLVTAAFNPMLSAGHLWKIQFDTYEREVERYGGREAIDVAEDVFFADSEAVLAILQGSPGDEGQDLRWRAALLGIDRLLSAFRIDLETRRARLTLWRDGTLRQAGIPAKQQLADRFRTERKRLEALLRESDADLEFAHAILQRRSERIAEAADRLRALATAGSLGVEMLDLVGSYTHMHVNRMLRSAAMKHEVVLYDFLSQLYDAELARRRRTGTGRSSTPEA